MQKRHDICSLARLTGHDANDKCRGPNHVSDDDVSEKMETKGTVMLTSYLLATTGRSIIHLSVRGVAGVNCKCQKCWRQGMFLVRTLAMEIATK